MSDRRMMVWSRSLLPLGLGSALFVFLSTGCPGETSCEGDACADSGSDACEGNAFEECECSPTRPGERYCENGSFSDCVCWATIDDVDCSACTEAEFCYYALDGTPVVSSSGCRPFPTECENDRTCDCMNTLTGDGNACGGDAQGACIERQGGLVVDCPLQC